MAEASYGARVWYAYACLPLDPETGKLPQQTKLEEAHGISRGLIGKLVSGKRHSATPEVTEQLATALQVTPAFLSYGTGPWPTLRNPGPIGPRIVTHNGQEKLPKPLHERVAPPTGPAKVTANSSGAPVVDTLSMAREATRQLSEAYGKAELEVWAEFLHPIEKYKGQPLASVSDMVREVGALLREQLVGAASYAGADPIMADEPGPATRQSPKRK